MVPDTQTNTEENVYRTNGNSKARKPEYGRSVIIFTIKPPQLLAKYKREAGVSVKIRFFYPLGNAVVISITFHCDCVSVEPIQEEFPSIITLWFCVNVCYRSMYNSNYLFRWIYTSQSSLCEFSVNMLGNYLTFVKEKQINQYCANILQGKVKIFSWF